MAPLPSLRFSRVAVLALALILLLPGVAAAQLEQAAKERIRLLNSQAMEQFDVLEFDAAKKKLEEALSEAEAHGLADDKSMALTHINLGVVHGAGFNDRLNAVKHFTEALKRNPGAAISAMRATPSLEEMYLAAKENVPPPKKKDMSLRHNPRDDVDAGLAVKITAMAGEDLEPYQVNLVYWGQGQRGRTKLSMPMVRPRVYVARIPASDVKGKSIYYYIEAQNEEGRRIQGHGSKGSPNIISVRGGMVPPPPGGDDKKEPEGDSIISAYLFFGTGFAVVHGGESENVHPLPPQGNNVTHDTLTIETGGALAPFHIAPEIAYHINNAWHISGLVRIQFVNSLKESADPKNPRLASRVSVLGLLRARRWFLDGPLKLYVAFGAGGGQIRHRIALGNYDLQPNGGDPTPNENERVDARVSQYVAFNVGGGLKYMFHRNIGVALDLSGIIMVPDFAAHLDVQLGPVISF